MDLAPIARLKQMAGEAGILLRQTLRHWSGDRLYQTAGSLSFFTLFSLSPLVIIVAAVAGTVLGQQQARMALVQRVEGWMGPGVGEMVESLAMRIPDHFQGFWPGAAGVLLMILGAVLVFLHLKTALNRIWGIQTRPGHPLRTLLRNRLVSFGMVLASGLLLVLVVLFGSLLKGLHRWLDQALPTLLPVLEWINGLAVLVIIFLAFALIYRFLPDARINWRPVWISSLAAALLFFGGRELISRYLGITSRVSVFGAAGALVALLLWVYYSALIFLLGAEFCQVLHRRYWPDHLQPAPHAVTVPKPAELIRKGPRSVA